MNGEKISTDGARGSDAVPETPRGLNGPTGVMPYAFMAKVAENLEAQNAEPRRLIAFGDPTPGDRPDPLRRPDGTLAPASKPWTPPKEQGPSRRVGA